MNTIHDAAVHEKTLRSASEVPNHSLIMIIFTHQACGDARTGTRTFTHPTPHTTHHAPHIHF
jgi:hypothetical protein